jgi:glycosyltransferase involved in cell wall biosynthesis
MSRIAFYCNETKSNLETFEYYKQDIDALKTLGHQVIICTKYREIPFDFDIMFIWWWTYALIPVLLSRLLRKPCIVTGTYNFRFPTDFDGIDYFRRPAWQKFLIKKATTLCTLNLFVNQIELESCSKYFKLNNAHYFPHVLQDDYLLGPSADRKIALFNISWCSKKNLIRKGIPELLEAIKLIKDEGIDIKLTLAGLKGDGTEFLLNKIDQLKITSETNYLGMISRDEKINLLRTNEIFVQPSHYEGFGVAIAEAMGCGACVIVCDVGAVREVVGNCGIYVKPGSPEELANAIKKALFDNNLRKDLQKNAYQRIYDNFHFNKKLERLKNYLLDVGIS